MAAAAAKSPSNAAGRKRSPQLTATRVWPVVTEAGTGHSDALFSTPSRFRGRATSAEGMSLGPTSVSPLAVSCAEPHT